MITDTMAKDDKQHWYTIKNVDNIDSPALIVYPDRVIDNIHTLKTMVGSNVDRLRPHVKTHKTTEATLLLMDAGIYQFKCATIAEAEMLAMCRAPDVLLAYQPVGPKLHRYMDLVKKYPDTVFSCLVDNEDAATALSTVAGENGINANVYVDLNVGMGRTGIAPGINALHLCQKLHQLDHIKLLGLHAYDGHLRDQDLSARRARCQEAFVAVWEMVAELKNQGYPRPTVIAGGSPTFPIHAADDRVVCSPGTFIFWDKGYGDGLPEQQFSPAALVLTRVVSLPSDTSLCLDLGHKSIAPENSLDRRVHFLNAPDMKPISQSEEHLVVEVPQGHQWKVGDVLYGLPYHICPTVALYERAITVAHGEFVAYWPITARNRKLNI
ncbi:D-TA family PLP-dependent enzyme [Parapedobacter tibetensis]|uniref:D-TA family PLP-dependent enzyme n=1 Tax=Parapedobacter tibetensis TaxID=2972951 RepID=UPI00214D4A94|nr:D-TA family PLP-dependent enzyme [Parapedobacter tibetensis]